MNIEELKARKRELGYTNKDVAEMSGVPLGTVQKIFGGATSHPRYETLKALEKVLFRKSTGNGSATYYYDPSYVGSAFAGESNLAVKYEAYGEHSAEKKQGEYTIEDYYRIPDDRRVELINGVIYDMSAPTAVHQFIIGEIFSAMRSYSKVNRKGCTPFMSPIDVRLDMDDRTMIQPDLIVLCHKKMSDIRRVEGAPDFVMEVLSPSSRQRDAVTKLNKYMLAGVREYWLIDPKAGTVMVYDFEHDNFPIHYTFDDKVPVSISGGDLVIDFSDICRDLDELFEGWRCADI